VSPRKLGLWASIAAALALVFWLVFFALPPLAVQSDVGKTRAERAKLRNDFRSTETQFLGGLALAAGLIFTWRTLRLNREGQLTDRFSKAIDQLGNEKLDVRLGGIYALERIARDSKRDHQPVMEVMTAYVRRYRRGDHEQFAAPPDVQAIMTVIGRRELRNDQRPLHLTAADLRQLDLREAQLADARMAYADFRGATLEGANLARADLYRAHLTTTRLDNADLREAMLNAADLENAILHEADVSGALYNGLTQWPNDFDPTAHGAVEFFD